MGMEVKKVDNNAEVTVNARELRTVAPQEENLSELLSNPIKESKSEETKSVDAQKEDKNFFLAHPKLSLLGTALIGLVLFSIGRNPKTLAKVLKGSSKAINPKYAEAEKTVAEIITKAKSGKYPELEKQFGYAMNMFKKPQYRSGMSLQIARLEKRMKEANIPADSELASRLSELKKKLNVYLDGVEKDLRAGNCAKWYERAEEFFNTNKPLVKKIEKLAAKHDLFEYWDSTTATLNSYVRSCPKEILPKNGVYFHGTRKAKQIYKNGINPFGSNQSAARELGAGIYTTPDTRVAGMFSMVHGTIMPLQLDSSAKVAFVDEAAFSKVSDRALSVLFEHFNVTQNIDKMSEIAHNAPLVESMMRRLFVEAGYDAAYMPKGMKAGLLSALMPDVNKVIGRPQSQLVVFNGEKLEIIDRKLFQRIGDVGSKFATYGNTLKYSWNFLLDIIKLFVKPVVKNA